MGSHPTKTNSSVVENNQINLTEEEDKTIDEDDENEKNLKDFVIIWFDNDPVDRRLKSLSTVTQSFTDSEKCVTYIKSIKREFFFNHWSRYISKIISLFKTGMSSIEIHLCSLYSATCINESMERCKTIS